jgi:hypothetical protein
LIPAFRSAEAKVDSEPMNPYSKSRNRDGTPSPTEPDEASNHPATWSLVLGILAFVIQLLAWGVWFMLDRQGDAAFERFLAGSGTTIEPPDVTGFWILFSVSLAVAISAIVFGVKGRRLAKVGAPKGRGATIGLGLGVGLIVVTVVGGIVWLAAFATIISHEL